MEMQLPDLEFDTPQEPVAALPDLEFDTAPEEELPELDFGPEYEAAPVMGESAPEDAPLDTSAAGVEMQPMTPGEYAGFVGESTAEVGKGMTAATIGLPGDIESIGRGVKEVVTSPETETAWSAFQRGLQEETALPTTQKVGEALFDKPTEEQKTLRTAGEFLSLEGALIKGISLARRAAKAPADKLNAKEANDFMDSYQEMLNTEIATGADPVAATNAANEYFNVTDDFVAKVSDKAKRKPHYFTPKKAQEALEVAEAVADPSKPSIVSRFFSTGLGQNVSEVGKAFDRGLGVISTRVRNISKPVFNRLRDLDRRQFQRIHQASVEIAPFLADVNKISKDMRPKFDLALANGDVKTVESMLTATGNPDAVNNFAKVRYLLDSLQEEAVRSGVEIGYITDYFPRVVTDVKGLRKDLGVEVDGDLDKLLAKAAEKKKSPLTEAEAADVINKYVRGYPKGIDGANAPVRTIETLTEDMLKHYAPSQQALQSYIHRMVSNIEQRRFLGQHKLDPETGIEDYEDSIGAYIASEKKKGNVSEANEQELRELLQARLAPGRIGSSVQGLKNAMYMGTLVDPIATITQFGDVALSAYHNGIMPTVNSIAKKVTGNNEVRLDDFGFKEMSEDLADYSKSRRWLDTMFKGTLFSAVDRLGKETILNSALTKHIEDVKDPMKLVKFKKEWGETFGDDFNQLVKDLKAGDNNSEHVQLLLWHRLADAQPISLSEMPEKYLKMNSGKLLYMLKTFTLKQFDIIRREGLQKLKDPATAKEGLANLTRYATIFTVAGMTTDEVKAQLLGRDVEISDLVEENLLKVIGLSRYSLQVAEREGTMSAITDMILPPVGLFDAMYTGIKTAITEQELDSRFVKALPLGDIVESRLLGGAEKYNEKAREKRTQEKRQAYGFGKSKDIQERRSRYGYGTGVKDVEKKRARYGYASGGLVSKLRMRYFKGDVVDQAQYQYMLTGDDRYLSDTPPVEEKAELPFEKREDRGLILPMYSEEDGLIAPEIIATPANAAVALGDAASGGDYTEEEMLESAVEVVPTAKAAGVAGKAAKKLPDQAVRALAYNAPNELPGFYGTPAERAAAVAKGGAQALLNIPQTILSPSAMKDAREMGFGFNTRRILEKQAKRINSAGKERAELAKKIEANKGGDVAKLQEKYDALGDDMKEASKVIVGQMTYNSNIAKQYGKESPIFKLWEGSIAEGTGMFNRDNFDLVMDSSIVPSRSFTKKDMDDFYGSISRAWKFDKTDKPINMVVRPVKFNSGGDFGEDFRKRSPYGRIIKQAVLETDNVPDFKKRLKELADEEGISTGLVDDSKRTANTKTTAMLNFGFKSSSYAEGGVNMVIKVNPKTKDYFFVVSDDHDLFGIVPRDADKLIAVTPVTRGNFKYGTAMSSTESEGRAKVLKDKEKRQTKKQRERDVANYRQQMDELETMKDTKAELIDPEFAKEARLSGIHTNIVNELLRKTHRATPKQLAERGGILAALGLGVASSTAQADEEQNATPFAKGGVADEERDPESVSTEGVDMSGGTAAQEALVEFIAENAPVTGEYLSGKQAVEDYKEGNYGSAVVGGIGALPLVGAITRKGTKAAKLLDDLFSNFTDEAVAAAKKDAQAYKSKEVLVEMPIKQFLDLAEDNFSIEKFRALNDVEKYDSVPYLYVEEAGDIAKVTGHDGRHRARQMMVKGKDTMPVMIKSHRYRWDQQTDPSKFDYKEDFPTILQGERGSTAELVRQEYDFPLKRGESGIVGFADGGLAEGNLNEEMTPEYDDTMDMPVEQPQQEVVVQAEAPQKPSIKMPEKQEKKHYTDEYLDRLAFIESSNNTNAYNKNSKALGLYQFVPTTWNNMVDRYMPELKKQKGDFMEFRRNPEVSRYMARKLMEENQNILKKKGFNDTKGNLYLAHFAGPGSALKVLRSKPNTRVEDVLSKGQIARNPGVFNKVKTTGQLIKWAQTKMLLDKFKK